MQAAPAIPIPRIRELGFRLARHEIPAAARSMLSFVMEPGEGEREEEHENQDMDDMDDMVGVDDLDNYASDERMGGHQWENPGGSEHEYEYHQEREVGYGGEQPAGEHEGRHDGSDEGSGMDAEDRGEIGPRRRQKPRKPRRPYTVTMALRKTNWFESSMEWEDEHFRSVYR
jgi:hypothetical protein